MFLSTIVRSLASFPGLRTQFLSLTVRTYVLQATKAGRGGLGMRLGSPLAYLGYLVTEGTEACPVADDTIPRRST